MQTIQIIFSIAMFFTIITIFLWLLVMYAKRKGNDAKEEIQAFLATLIVAICLYTALISIWITKIIFY